MDRRIRRAASAAALVLAAMLRPGAHATAQTGSCVTAPAGRICGGTDTATVGSATFIVPAFRGIRYAAPPTGAARWKAPSAATLASPYPATKFGNVCMQAKAPPGQTMGEDCLFLNVWTPSTSGKLPVLVFIHGGAFVEGSGSSGLYNGTYLASFGKRVVVTLNYRLGAYGFLYGSWNGAAVGGNLGLLDQQLALQWVRTNIGAFGGDTSRVTIFGESAGAMSVGFHLFAMPGSDGLFKAAIMESNPLGYPYRTAAQAQADGTAFLDHLCDISVRCRANRKDASWMQSVTEDEIKLANDDYLAGLWGRLKQNGLPEGLPWAPFIDGTVVTGQPFAGYGPQNHPKPFIFGINHDEGVVFAGAASSLHGFPVLDADRYDTLLVSAFGTKNAAAITAATAPDGTHPYSLNAHAPVPPLDSVGATLAHLLTDFAFNCANLTLADTVLKAFPTDTVLGYRFQEPPFFNLYKSSDACLPGDGYACHAYELPYVFSTFAYADTLNGNTAKPGTGDYGVAALMGAAWVAFSGNHAAAGWTPYASAGELMTFGPPAPYGRMQGGLSGDAVCSMWRGMPPFGPKQ